MKRRLKVLVVAVLGAASFAAGCNDSPPSTAPTPTPAQPTVTESFVGTLPVGGNKFYSFKISQFGIIQVSLVSVSGAGVPETVTLGLGVGTPSGTSCSATNTINAAITDMQPQFTTTLDVGVYCAAVFDPGNLTAPAGFSVTIAHP